MIAHQTYHRTPGKICPAPPPAPPFGLDESIWPLNEIKAHQVDEADLYFQYTRSEGWSLEGGCGMGSFSIDQGVGVTERLAARKPPLPIPTLLTFQRPACWMRRTVRTISSAAQTKRTRLLQR
jgi:TldD protein